MLCLSSTALAEWEDASSLTLYNFTSATTVSTSLLKTSPIATSATDSIGFLRSGSLTRYPLGVIPSGDKVAFVVFENGNNWITSGTKFRFQVGTSVTFGDYGSQNQSVCNTRSRKYYARNGTTWNEIQPGTDGVFSLSYSPTWLGVAFVVEDVPSTSGYNQYVSTSIPDKRLLVEIPDPTFQSTIEDQTQELTSTEGSNTVGSDAVSSGVQQYEALPIISLVGQTLDGFQQTLNTQEQDGTIAFPGLQMSGFVVPTVTVDPMSLVSEDMQMIIRTMLTFVFCSAFLAHIIRLAEAVFGIAEYGVGYEDFGQGQGYYAPQQVVQWKGDYSVDEDLGF